VNPLALRKSTLVAVIHRPRLVAVGVEQHAEVTRATPFVAQAVSAEPVRKLVGAFLVEDRRVTPRVGAPHPGRERNGIGDVQGGSVRDGDVGRTGAGGAIEVEAAPAVAVRPRVGFGMDQSAMVALARAVGDERAAAFVELTGYRPRALAGMDRVSLPWPAISETSMQWKVKEVS
jgi:hypothetical protein